MLIGDRSCFENRVYPDQLASTGYINHTFPLVVHIIVYAVKKISGAFEKTCHDSIFKKKSFTFSVFEDYIIKALAEFMQSAPYV